MATGQTTQREERHIGTQPHKPTMEVAAMQSRHPRSCRGMWVRVMHPYGSEPTDRQATGAQADLAAAHNVTSTVCTWVQTSCHPRARHSQTRIAGWAFCLQPQLHVGMHCVREGLNQTMCVLGAHAGTGQGDTHHAGELEQAEQTSTLQAQQCCCKHTLQRSVLHICAHSGG